MRNAPHSVRSRQPLFPSLVGVSTSGGDLELEFLFDGGSPSERVNIIFSAAADAGVLREDVQFLFNVAGRCGDPFMLEQIAVRCCSRRYLDSNDDLAISACPNTLNEWVQLDLQWQQEALKFEDRSTDEDELRTRLRELRQIFRGVFVLISVPGDTSLNDLVPLLEICQSTGCSMDLSFQSITERQRLLGRMISTLPFPAKKSRALSHPLKRLHPGSAKQGAATFLSPLQPSDGGAT
jgi:hypothetical protein